jgi:hypothetical protein
VRKNRERKVQRTSWGGAIDSSAFTFVQSVASFFSDVINGKRFSKSWAEGADYAPENGDSSIRTCPRPPSIEADFSRRRPKPNFNCGVAQMIGATISHCKILEELGEVPKSLPTLCVGIATLRIQPFHVLCVPPLFRGIGGIPPCPEAFAGEGCSEEHRRGEKPHLPTILSPGKNKDCRVFHDRYSILI